MDKRYIAGLSGFKSVSGPGNTIALRFEFSVQVLDIAAAGEVMAEIFALCGAPGEKFSPPEDFAFSGDYIVADVNAEKDDTGCCRVIYECLPAAGAPEICGNITDSLCENGTLRRRALWRIPLAALSASRPVCGEIFKWNGEDFICREVEERSDLSNPGEKYFAVTADRYICGMLSCLRQEHFSGFDGSNHPRQSVVWRSLWRIHPDKLPDFAGLTGTAPEWADFGAVITSVEPEMVNQNEILLTITAENSDGGGKYQQDDRRYLGKRRDYRVRLCDFRISPEMAGYKYEGGALVPDEEWEGTSDSPFSGQGDTPLPQNMVNAVLRCVCITETFYLAGRASGVLGSLVEWGEERIFSGTVGSVSGSFLRSSMDCDEICDSQGNVWTKVVRTFQKSPARFTWNSAYWQTH